MQVVQSWQDLWVLVGEVGATLSGLLFVAVSFNLRTIMSKAHPHLRTSAFRTFSQFVLLIEIAIAFQIPQEEPGTLGITIILFAAVAIATNRYSTKGLRLAFSRENLFLGYGSFVTVAIAGFLIMLGLEVGFYLLLMLAFFILISAVTSAWQLLIDVGEDESPSVSAQDGT